MTYRDTSRAAYATAQIGENEERVLSFVKSAGSHGATCDEAIRTLGMQHQSASPAFTTLERKGWLRRTDRRRTTGTGSAAAVYLFTEPGTLFSSPKVGKADQYRALIRAALAARQTGDWMAFDEAWGALPQAERKRITN
jgi:hypothetical protein